MRVPHDSLVLVADGAKMLFFRNEGDAEYPVLKAIAAEQQPSLKDSDIKTDSSGRASGGGGTMGENDFHVQAEERFAVETADRLNSGALAGDYEKLVVVAPPKTLGLLRKHYHSEVERRLIRELPKDLTGHPVDRIEQALAREE